MGAPAPQKVWIPVDVKIRWFGFLGVPDLCVASRVCKAWGSLVGKTADAEIAMLTGTGSPQIGRPGRLKLLHRLHHAYQAENMGYLLAWAAGSRGGCGTSTSGTHAVHNSVLA